MPDPARPQKISFRDTREQGVRGILIYCADYHCSHSVAISAIRWPRRVSDYRMVSGLVGRDRPKAIRRLVEIGLKAKK